MSLHDLEYGPGTEQSATERGATAVLTLAHSPDPDDAFMWWPLTGRIEPPSRVGGEGPARVLTPPLIGENERGGLRFVPVAADIEALNRRALEKGDLDITALSVRRWADVRDRYIITSCGASFGDGFGPRLVARSTDARILCERCLCKPGVVIAVPGMGTTAFLMLGLLLQELARGAAAEGAPASPPSPPRFMEMPFDQIIGAVADGRADVGLVIHEGQLSFAEAGLSLIADVGAWWKERTGLKLPLGVNAMRRDLDARHGPGTISRVSALLRRSVAMAMERWDESVAYTIEFARANVARSGGRSEDAIDPARVDRYCRMYVTQETLDMGDAGREAIRRLLAEGASAGLVPAEGGVAEIETI